MSDTDNTSATPDPSAVALSAAPSPRPRNIYLTALMVLAGIVLLLPGLCSMAVGAYSLYISDMILVLGYSCPIGIGLLIGIVGVMVIRAAIRGPRR